MSLKIGLLADTHDNVHAIRFLVEFFHMNQVDSLIHAGDFIAPFTIPELNRFDGPVRGVFGNNDGDRETLREKTGDTTVELYEAPYQLSLGGHRILISHRPEDLPDPVPEAVDVVVYGHTHRREISREQRVLRLNPGEAGGWLTDTTQAMVLDTDSLQVHPHVWPAP